MSELNPQTVLWLIPGAPLVAAIVTALVGPKILREKSHLLCWLALAISAVCSLILLCSIVPAGFQGHQGKAVGAEGYPWMVVGNLNVQIDVQADAMTALMLAMVTFISLLVAIFAAGYMHGDPGFARFFACISLFVFSMCMLVLARNFLVLFVFWE